MRTVVHLEHAADDARVAAKFLLPVFVAQHEHGVRAEAIVSRHERAPQRRPDAEHLEEVRGHHTGIDSIRLALIEQHEIHRVVFDEVGNRVQTLAILEQLGNRDQGIREIRERRGLLNQHELVALAKRQRLEQDAVDH